MSITDTAIARLDVLAPFVLTMWAQRPVAPPRSERLRELVEGAEVDTFIGTVEGRATEPSANLQNDALAFFRRSADVETFRGQPGLSVDRAHLDAVKALRALAAVLLSDDPPNVEQVLVRVHDAAIQSAAVAEKNLLSGSD